MTGLTKSQKQILKQMAGHYRLLRWGDGNQSVWEMMNMDVPESTRVEKRDANRLVREGLIEVKASEVRSRVYGLTEKARQLLSDSNDTNA